MFVIHAENVNDAWQLGKKLLAEDGVLRQSRAGEVIEYPEPVTTRYVAPRERVLFDEERDANPFFHLFEAMWMLAGRRDVAWLGQFNQNMTQPMFTDDGITYYGAYGHRWKKTFTTRKLSYDCDVKIIKPGERWDNLHTTNQLEVIIEMLKTNHDERRAVLQMWAPNLDLGHKGVDVPCNTNIYFKIRDRQLHMTVCNRSNDIVWGCYGANVVHMSVLQEYMAAMIGVEVGPYYQISDSFHAYTAVVAKMGGLYYDAEFFDPYKLCKVTPYQMVDVPDLFAIDLEVWMESTPFHNNFVYSNSFFHNVLIPMRQAWSLHKTKNYGEALVEIGNMADCDWKLACNSWLNRRMVKHLQAVQKVSADA